jgi:hypothetical protein
MLDQILKNIFCQLGFNFFPWMKAEIEMELVAVRCDKQGCNDQNLFIRIMGGNDEDDSL